MFAADHPFVCETPKSPPGDYNAWTERRRVEQMPAFRVKHLNPRQGITTKQVEGIPWPPRADDQCETPKFPPGDYNDIREVDILPSAIQRVKHLNPRQGITTQSSKCSTFPLSSIA